MSNENELDTTCGVSDEELTYRFREAVRMLHLLRGLFPPVAAAACCTGAAWLCHTYAQPLGMLLSAAAASGVGCLVYLAVWGLLMRCRKQKG